MDVIEIDGLRKEYRKLRGGRVVAIDGLSLSVPAGTVFGFLGPNGSGKTTTIRCLLGLARATSGTSRIFGVDSTELHQVARRIGSIVESPALFPTFTGRRNLELLAAMRGIDESRIDEVLDLVGLKGRDDDLVKRYSLGMRQRLAIGAALLADPELLILDEPANGLDPSGIREVRELLRTLGDEGRTVLVSSHILSEIQHVCDEVAILARGRCITSGRVSEVLARGHSKSMIVKTHDLEATAEILLGAGLTATIDGAAVRVSIDPAEGARISELLGARGLYPYELRPDDVDLETVFLELTGEVAA